MAFPTMNFKHTNTEVDYALETVLENKLHSLEKYMGTATGVCDVEFEKVTNQQSGDIYRVEVNMVLDGKQYRAEATKDSFEKAIDEVRDELDKELRRSNKKKESLIKKGGRKIKEMMRFGR